MVLDTVDCIFNHPRARINSFSSAAEKERIYLGEFSLRLIPGGIFPRHAGDNNARIIDAFRIESARLGSRVVFSLSRELWVTGVNRNSQRRPRARARMGGGVTSRKNVRTL